MAWRYWVFGLIVEADRPIPGLAATAATIPADVHLDTSGLRPPIVGNDSRDLYVSPCSGHSGQPALRVSDLSDGRLLRFLYDDGAEFLIDRQGSRIWAIWPKSMTINDVVPYLQGPILAFVLRLREVTSLHASAIVVEDEAVAFLGPPGAGKSTTAAAFARMGYPVLSDDIVALIDQGDRLLVNPGYPWLRLWEPSVEALFGSGAVLPRISPDDPSWSKRFLDLSGGGLEFQPEPVPLAAVYVLGPRRSEEDAPRIEQLAAPAKLLSLIRNTYMNYLPDREARAREFDVLVRMMGAVPVRVVTPHSSSGRLARLCELILGDYAEIKKDPPPDAASERRPRTA